MQVKTGESEKTRGSKEKTDGRFSVADEPYSESEVTTVLFVHLRIWIKNVSNEDCVLSSSLRSLKD